MLVMAGQRQWIAGVGNYFGPATLTFVNPGMRRRRTGANAPDRISGRKNS
jgi:hypothetical protein